MRSINRPFYGFFLSNTGGRKCRLLVSRTLWRAAGWLKQKSKKHLRKLFMLKKIFGPQENSLNLKKNKLKNTVENWSIKVLAAVERKR